MCIDCCPVKMFTGKLEELYANYVGNALGEFVLAFSNICRSVVTEKPVICLESE